MAWQHRRLRALFSLSKAYAFASWRIGYMVVPEHLYPAILKIQDTNLICAPVISQHAAAGALEIGAAYCRERLPAIDRVRVPSWTAWLRSDGDASWGRREGAFVRVCLDRHGPVGDGSGTSLDTRRRGDPGAHLRHGLGGYLWVSFGALDRDTADEGVRRLVRGPRALA